MVSCRRPSSSHHRKACSSRRAELSQGQGNHHLRLEKALYWAASIIAAGLAVLGISSSLAGCGHDVTITPDHTEICKDGSCLVLDKNGQSITYRQNAPEPPATAEQAPVVIKQEK